MNNGEILGFVDVLKAYWWLFVTAGGLMAMMYKITIGVNRATEALKQVGINDGEIKKIWGKTRGYETSVENMQKDVSAFSKSLEEHVKDQKADLCVITNTLFSILDVLKDIGGEKDAVKSAHNQLRRHSIDK